VAAYAAVRLRDDDEVLVRTFLQNAGKGSAPVRVESSMRFLDSMENAPRHCFFHHPPGTFIRDLIQIRGSNFGPRRSKTQALGSMVRRARDVQPARYPILPSSGRYDTPIRGALIPCPDCFYIRILSLFILFI